ncbi:endo alpha-1,4 polygalactosaminidase [Amycolatopsis sp. GA6-003]|uniref:endo alpha-1,4 polygalactosaminidase n=1 Tax=Amycolatopsis sp. GA6-003 TaxID=2652444 RepID=UPI0039172E4E
MPSLPGRISRGTAAAALLIGSSACTLGAAGPAQSAPLPAPHSQVKDVSPPAPHAGFDYQIGGPYRPPAGVQVVSRDHSAPAEAGQYNICYVNAFQAQPGAEGEWGDLVLRDDDGNVVKDPEWNEALLDLRTADNRNRIAAKVGGWIDECARKGYQAIEPDNYDSFTRSQGLLSARNAQDLVKLLSGRAHGKGLAIAQKNTSELASSRADNGLDFAVAEECGEQDNCAEYTQYFGNHVIVIEYTDAGLRNACAKWGATLSVVQRDRDVTPKGDPAYVRKTC